MKNERKKKHTKILSQHREEGPQYAQEHYVLKHCQSSSTGGAGHQLPLGVFNSHTSHCWILFWPDFVSEVTILVSAVHKPRRQWGSVCKIKVKGAIALHEHKEHGEVVKEYWLWWILHSFVFCSPLSLGSFIILRTYLESAWRSLLEDLKVERQKLLPGAFRCRNQLCDMKDIFLWFSFLSELMSCINSSSLLSKYLRQTFP